MRPMGACGAEMRIVFSSLSDRFRHSSVSVSSVGTPWLHLRRGSLAQACAVAGGRGGTQRYGRGYIATYSASLHLRRDLSCGFDDLRRQLSAWAPRVLVFPPLARPCRRSDTHQFSFSFFAVPPRSPPPTHILHVYNNRAAPRAACACAGLSRSGSRGDWTRGQAAGSEAAACRLEAVRMCVNSAIDV